MCKKSSCRSWELVSALGACVGLGTVAHDCNSALGGQGQLGCMWTVSHGSLSELWIGVYTKLFDVDSLS